MGNTFRRCTFILFRDLLSQRMTAHLRRAFKFLAANNASHYVDAGQLFALQIRFERLIFLSFIC